MSGSALAFKYFPSQLWRPAGVNAEFDASQANTATQNQRALVVGQITSACASTFSRPWSDPIDGQITRRCLRQHDRPAPTPGREWQAGGSSATPIPGKRHRSR